MALFYINFREELDKVRGEVLTINEINTVEIYCLRNRLNYLLQLLVDNINTGTNYFKIMSKNINKLLEDLECYD